MSEPMWPMYCKGFCDMSYVAEYDHGEQHRCRKCGRMFRVMYYEELSVFQGDLKRFMRKDRIGTLVMAPSQPTNKEN